jgi:hypothetical protein
MYGALLFCALGERLQREWKSHAMKGGRWKPQWEEAAAHVLAVRVLKLPPALEQDLAVSQDARTCLRSIRPRAALPMITRLKRGASLHEFFRNDTEPL